MSTPNTSLTLVASATHAMLGPSGAYRWSSCTAAPGKQQGYPNTTNKASRWGTACHLLSETCLKDGSEPADHFGRVVAFWEHPESSSYGEDFFDTLVDESGELLDDTGCLEIRHLVEIDDEQVRCAATFVKFVRDIVATTGGQLLVEQRVSIEHITKEPGAKGTADVVILVPAKRLIIVIDLKGGLMQVDASDTHTDEDPVLGLVTTTTPNLQLAMYGDGALTEAELFDEYDTIELHIVQPRLNHFDSITLSVEKLRETISWLRGRAELTRTNPQFAPSYKNCLFCRAKDDCEARDRSVLRESAEGFGESFGDEQELPQLGVIYERLDQIEDWCTGKRKQVRAELMAGNPVVGLKGPYKLIQGDSGDRMWADPIQAEFALLDAGVPPAQVYKSKVISPNQAEALTRAKKGHPPALPKTTWAELQGAITRGEPGAPKIVPASDPRPAYSPATEGFADLDDVQN